MNDDRAFERATRDWLETGSDQTPAATIDAVLLAVRTTPQERDLRIPWRTPTMPKSLRLAAMIAVVAVAGIGAAAILRNGTTIGPGPTSSPSTAPSLTTSPTPTPSVIPSATATPSSGAARIPHGPLVAGAYTTTVFLPHVTFAVGNGWINQSEATDLLVLRFGDNAHQVSIGRVVGDPLVYARPNPEYALGAPVSLTVAGLAAQETSVELSASAALGSFYSLSATADSVASGGDATLDLNLRGTKARAIVVQVGDQQVVILVQRPLAGDQTSFDAAAQALIDSIAFN